MDYAPALLRVAAVLCFLLAYFGVNPGGKPLEALGLALWCLCGPYPAGWKLPG